MVTDGAALETVLKNLLDNSFKYSNEPVHVTVSARRSETGTTIEVRDYGIGIAAKHLKRLFERFYRVPSEAVYARSGTGLGLFVVSSLVRNMGGRMRVHSDGPERGTSFCVELPQAAATPRGSP